MRDAVIVSAVRTPIGRAGGALASVRADDLAAVALRGAVERAQFDPARLDELSTPGCHRNGPFVPTLHFVEISKDRRVYIGERGQNRIQVFTTEGKWLQDIYVSPNSPAQRGGCGGLDAGIKAPRCKSSARSPSPSAARCTR